MLKKLHYSKFYMLIPPAFYEQGYFWTVIHLLDSVKKMRIKA